MKYTLLHVGTPRTGTTSLWKLLAKHEEIAVSRVKEPIWKWDKKVDNYLDWFDIKDGTKVLCDCTPTSILLVDQRQYFYDLNQLESIERRCCLFARRPDPVQRVKSFLGSLLADHYLRQMHSTLIVDGKLAQNKLEFVVKTYINDDKLLDLTRAFFGAPNVFVVNLHEFNDKIDSFYHFLGVSLNNHKLEHHKNHAEFENTLNYVQYLKDLKIAHDYVDSIKGD